VSGEVEEETEEGLAIGRMAHRMNNALAYVLTNLNLLVEQLEVIDGLSAEERARLLRLSEDASDGAERMGELIRQMQEQNWSDTPTAPKAPGDSTDRSEDTWDAESKAARILIVDDEQAILTSLRIALSRYQVESVEDGQAAIDRLTSDPPFDLILCDLIMPGVGGADVHKWASEHQPELLPRIIFMTGGAFTVDVRDFLGTVPCTVLHKPFDTKTLRWMVAQQLRRTSD